MTKHSRKPKVFISHASPDLWVAKQLENQVRNCGADTFLDSQQIEHGDDFEEVIISESDDSTEMLVLFTPIASERKYVWLEIGMFLGYRKRIVAALYGVSKADIAKDPFTPVALKRMDSVDLSNIDSYFEQLKGRVDAWRQKNG
jgi:hypothetical protein